jgi:hypothetical protein
MSSSLWNILGTLLSGLCNLGIFMHIYMTSVCSPLIALLTVSKNLPPFALLNEPNLPHLYYEWNLTASYRTTQHT